MLVSSTEPLQLQELGKASTKPEEFGVDFLWFVRHKNRFAGVQRKTVMDYIASIKDGRLGKEIAQWENLSDVLLVLEGSPTLVGDMVAVNGWAKVPLDQWYGTVWMVQEAGAKMVITNNTYETGDMVRRFMEWTRRVKHTSLQSRPKQISSSWGIKSSREFGLHILQGFPGVGRGTAEAIFDQFGRVPLAWTISQAEMLSVPGVGKKTVERLWNAL